MPAKTIYEERIGANSLLIAGVSLWALALGLVPGILLGGWWWFFSLYIVLSFGIIIAFLHMKVELSQERLVVKFGFVYRKVIDVARMQDCSPYKMEHPVKVYGGWGIRRGSDGTFALTQAFINEAIKLETIDQTFVISSRKAEDLCRAIKQARG
jgi:hypothetical protein